MCLVGVATAYYMALNSAVHNLTLWKYRDAPEGPGFKR
jgi:hypothetical protein